MVFLLNLHMSAVPLLVLFGIVMWVVTVAGVLFTVSKINKNYKSNS